MPSSLSSSSPSYDTYAYKRTRANTIIITTAVADVSQAHNYKFSFSEQMIRLWTLTAAGDFNMANISARKCYIRLHL